MEEETRQDAPQDPAPAAPIPAPPELTPAACAERLAGLFPALFGPDAPARPVKLRIHADIQQRAPGQFTRKTLSLFLHRHTTGTAYLKALVGAPCRVDLDGEPAGDIAQEHREAARQELERRRAVSMSRRAAQGQGQARGPRALPRSGAGSAVADAQSSATSGSPRASASEGQRQTAGDRPGRDLTRTQAPKPPRQERSRGADAPAVVQGHGAGDTGRRERALLLRTWESSPLTKVNFCVLKRITPAELDAQLDLARQERSQGVSDPGA